MFSIVFRHAPRVAQRSGVRTQRAYQSTKLIPYKQDLPPVEGYKAFDWQRVHAKPGWSAGTKLLAYAISTIYGYTIYQLCKKRYFLLKLESLDAKLALEPLLFAERDRMYLKGVRQVVEEEARLMKDVPGWELGKWYHEPVYKTVPANHWVDMHSFEFWNHRDRYDHEAWCHWYYHS